MNAAALEPFEPENDLERLIAEAKAGVRPVSDALDALPAATLFISSRKEILQDGSGFEPLLLGQGGEKLVAVFTSLARPALHREVAEYVAQMTGGAFFQRLPPSFGVVINPGYTAQLVLQSAAVAQVKERIR